MSRDKISQAITRFYLSPHFPPTFEVVRRSTWSEKGPCEPKVKRPNVQCTIPFTCLLFVLLLDFCSCTGLVSRDKISQAVTRFYLSPHFPPTFEVMRRSTWSEKGPCEPKVKRPNVQCTHRLPDSDVDSEASRRLI